MGHFFGFIITILALGIGLVAAVLFGVVRLLGGQAKTDKADEETRLIQDMYATMNKLEDRVESLETILLERERKE